MHNKFWILILGCLIGITACKPAPKKEFVLSDSQLNSLVNNRYAIEYKSGKNQNGHYYILNLVFEKTDPAQHFIIDIKTAEYGSLFSTEENKKAGPISTNLDNNAIDTLLYPKIGSRAKQNLLAFGPGGTSEQIQFSTDDKALDIVITLSHALPNNVHIELSLIDMAQQINSYYRASQNGEMSQEKME